MVGPDTGGPSGVLNSDPNTAVLGQLRGNFSAGTEQEENGVQERWSLVPEVCCNCGAGGEDPSVSWLLGNPCSAGWFPACTEGGDAAGMAAGPLGLVI